MIRFAAAFFSLMVMCSLAVAQDRPPLPALLDGLATRDDLKPLKAVIVARAGSVVAERGYRGNRPADSTNIKSASKSIVSALVGIAIDKGLLEGADQKIAPILKADLPASPDPRLQDITIGNLLSMQAGLGRMSGPNYGRWVSSRNWVRFALAQPFDDDPGGQMLYIVPALDLTVVMTSEESGPSARTGYRDALHLLLGEIIGTVKAAPRLGE